MVQASDPHAQSIKRLAILGGLAAGALLLLSWGLSRMAPKAVVVERPPAPAPVEPPPPPAAEEPAPLIETLPPPEPEAAPEPPAGGALTESDIRAIRSGEASLRPGREREDGLWDSQIVPRRP